MPRGRHTVLTKIATSLREGLGAGLEKGKKKNRPQSTYAVITTVLVPSRLLVDLINIFFLTDRPETSFDRKQEDIERQWTPSDVGGLYFALYFDN